MFDMILDNYRKATESTMKLQQEMLRNWTTQWPQMFGLPNVGHAFSGHDDAWRRVAREVRRGPEEVGRDGHRDAEQASRDARCPVQGGNSNHRGRVQGGRGQGPQQFRRLTEELWKQSFECFNTVVESQMRDVQAAMQKCYEVASKSAAGI